MLIKQILSAFAFLVTIVLFGEYVRSIRAAKTVPHVFSWVIWAAGTLTVFFAQLVGGAGVGAWPIGFSACLTAYIAYLSYRKREHLTITKIDWVFLVMAAAALPAWWLTSEPVWAVILLTFADVIAFGPTVRRAYRFPCQEHGGFFALGALRNFLVVLALEHYSLTTALFPAVVGIACLGVACVVYVRRMMLPHDSRQPEMLQ